MSEPILATKLFAPPQEANNFDRLELITSFTKSQARFYLISAPAGFGKTSLASTIVKGFSGQVAWLSLDAEDSDLKRFIRYLLASLQTVNAGIAKSAEPMLTAERVNATSLMVTLINDLLSYTHPVLLVLDDYHLVANQEVHDLLGLLLEHQPSNLKLLIASRADPPFALAKLRAKGKLLEFRAEDLRFHKDEIKTFFASHKLELDDAQLGLLQARTEGWITGLKLAALSLRNHKDKQVFIESFSGSHRFVLDYLLEEVLEQEDAEIRGFLLATSILPRFSAALCNHLLGFNNSDEVLAYLEKSNLFLIPLDDERQWFRYHHLFADLLRHRLAYSAFNLEQLHEQASDWFSQEGFLDEAIQHAALAQAFDKATLLIQENSSDLLLWGDVNRLERWLGFMPEALTISHPRLAEAKAWVLVLRSRGQEALALLDKVDAFIKEAGQSKDALASVGVLSNAELESAKAYLLTCRAVAMISAEAELSEIIRLFKAALELFPKEDVDGRCVPTFYLGAYALMQADYSKAYDYFKEAARLGQKGQQAFIGLSALGSLIALLRDAAKLREADALCHEALRYSETQMSLSGQAIGTLSVIYLELGHVHYEWNDLDVAEQHLRQGLYYSKGFGLDRTLQQVQMLLAQVLLAQGQSERAIQMIHSARSLLDLSHFPDVLKQNLEEEGFMFWLLLAQTNPAYLGQCKQIRGRFKTELKQPLLDMYYHLLLENYDDVLEKVAEQRKKLNPNHQKDLIIKLQLIEAITYLKTNQEAKALSCLQETLTQAEDESYLRSFLNMGESMLVLLKKLATKRKDLQYLKTLIQAFPKQPKINLNATEHLILEPLSERELEILRLLPTGRSSPDLAMYLDVSVNTIKTHMKNIYSKLAVHKRHEAVERAKELGFI